MTSLLSWWPFAVVVAVGFCALTPDPALAQDEVHWLDEDRYLISYKVRESKNTSRAIANAHEKAAALCQLADRSAYSLNISDLRERLQISSKRVALDVLLLDAVPEDTVVGRVARSCQSGRVDRKVLTNLRKALERAGIRIE